VTTTFRALRHANFRRFYGAFIVSLVGVWMHRVALSWLVVDLTGSAFYVGLADTLGSLPVLVFSLHAGAIADRVSKRSMVLVTQTSGMMIGFAFAAIVYSGHATIELILVVATLAGVSLAFDIPARQSFLVDLVGKDDLTNAIALNSSAFNASRVVGPAIAGVLIGVAGVGICFLLNAITFIPVIAVLSAMRLPVTTPPAGGAGAWGNIKEGLRYAGGEPRIRRLLVNIAVMSVFGFSVFVLLPVLVKSELGRGADVFGWMMSAVGIGAVVGALAVATFAERMPKGRMLGWAAMGFGLLVLVLGFVRSVPWLLVTLTVMGLMLIVTTALTNTLLQAVVPDHLRGRVLALYTVAFVGMAPFGSLLAGIVADRFGVGVMMALGGIVTVLSSVVTVVVPAAVRETA